MYEEMQGYITGGLEFVQVRSCVRVLTELLFLLSL